MKLRTPALLGLGLAVAMLTGCASRGARSPDARPVLYPNAEFKQIGEARAREEVDLCMGSASRAGLSPEEKDNAAGRGAVRGAAVLGTASAVGALVRGRGLDGALTAATRGAAVGGATGAVSGALRDDKPNLTYRNFVQRCVSERGLEIIGWQ